MSFVRITKTNTDNSVVRLHPSRSFTSSSSGVTGSVRVIAQASPSFKDVTKFSPFDDSPISEDSVEAHRVELFTVNEDSFATASGAGSAVAGLGSANMAVTGAFTAANLNTLEDLTSGTISGTVTDTSRALLLHARDMLEE